MYTVPFPTEKLILSYFIRLRESKICAVYKKASIKILRMQIDETHQIIKALRN